MSLTHVIFDHDGTLVDTTGPKFRLYPNNLTLLNWCRDKKIPCYLWTARDRKSTIESLKNLDILNYFEDIHTSTDGDTKPSTQGLLHMLEGARPEYMVVIGDSTSDMMGGARFGAKTIGAVWAHTHVAYADLLKKQGAQFIAKNVQEVIDILNNLYEGK